MIIGLLVFALVGILCLVLGYLLWRKQRITLIHSYHYPYVKQEDVPAYTRGMGQALLLLGAAILLTGVINWASGTVWGFAAFGAGFLVYVVWVLRLQRRYNRRG